MQPQTPARVVTPLDRARWTIFVRGHYLAVWGSAFSVGMAYTDLWMRWQLALPPFIVWSVVIVSACTYTAVRMQRERIQSRVDTQLDRFHLGQWQVCAAATTLIFFANSVDEGWTPHGITGCAATLLAMPFFMAGQAIQERWLLSVGMSWLASACALFVSTPPANAGLVFAGCVLLFLVVPGVAMQVMAHKLAAEGFER